MKLKKNVIYTLEEIALLAMFMCFFVGAFLFFIGIDL
nr:MAG TPA: hypothetical protein [Caudoviricetes sp.]